MSRGDGVNVGNSLILRGPTFVVNGGEKPVSKGAPLDVEVHKVAPKVLPQRGVLNLQAGRINARKTQKIRRSVPQTGCNRGSERKHEDVVQKPSEETNVGQKEKNLRANCAVCPVGSGKPLEKVELISEREQVAEVRGTGGAHGDANALAKKAIPRKEDGVVNHGRDGS